MKAMLKLFLLLLFLFLVTGCSMNSLSAAGAQSDLKPPFPRTKSILPLALGNSWVFSYTEYDSLGKMINPNRLDLHLSIEGGYGMVDSSTLVPVEQWTTNKIYPAYAYRFEWEEQKKGYLIVYRDLYPLAKRGLYIIGKYKNSAVELFPTEQLWLAYPADSGKTWQYSEDGSGDSSSMSSMELISTKSRFYFPSATSMTALSFCDCYVYKETIGSSVYYYYFNETIGQVGYQEFVSGKLRVTYLLKSSSLKTM